ncbi:MAG TPA: phosphate ABC transporter permease PstA [Candidatus Acidoferrales bacterium]
MKLRALDTGFVLLAGLAILLIVAMLAVILGNITIHGWEQVSWEFISAAPETGMTEGGIFPAIFGTVLLVLLMTIFVVPLGVAVAIYFSEYADRNSWLYRWSRQAVNNLAGVPSIVFGLFGLGFFVQFVGGGIDNTLFGGQLTFGQPALIWAALTMAVLTLPVVIVSVEEALQAVPRHYRDASLALGATRTQTIFRVVLPQAMAGVLTGGILAVSRGAGEVAPILFVGAAYFLPHLPTRLNDQFMELGYHIYVLSTQSPDVEATKPLLYGTVLVLLVLTFLLNLTAIAIRARLRLAAGRTR